MPDRQFTARRSVDPRGHAYTEANTYRNPRGSRECRTCKRSRSRAA